MVTSADMGVYTVLVTVQNEAPLSCTWGTRPKLVPNKVRGKPPDDRAAPGTEAKYPEKANTS